MLLKRVPFDLKLKVWFLKIKKPESAENSATFCVRCFPLVVMFHTTTSPISRRREFLFISAWKLFFIKLTFFESILIIDSTLKRVLQSYSLKLCAIFGSRIMCWVVLGSDTPPNVPWCFTANCSSKRDVSISTLLVLPCVQNDFPICNEINEITTVMTSSSSTQTPGDKE